MAVTLLNGMQFSLEDVLQGFNGVPDFLQNKDAEGWFIRLVAKLRLKNIGREELAWLLGVPLECLAEALPSSACEELLGLDMLSIGYLPRGAGCSIHDCRSLAFLNGRKATLCKHCTDEATHAFVLVEGGPGEQFGEELGKPILIARKNLTYDRLPDQTGQDQYPSVELYTGEDEPEPEFGPLEYLGDAWFDDPAIRPSYLMPAESWLSRVVGNLVTSKGIGREELCYILDLPKDGSATGAGFGGMAVHPSISEDCYDKFAEELGFIPSGSICLILNSNSFPHYNERQCFLVDPCADGETHALINLDGEQVHIHRKNLKLLSPDGKQPKVAVAGEQPPPPPPPPPPPDADAVRPANARQNGATQPDDGAGNAGWLSWLFSCGACTKQEPARISAQVATFNPAQPSANVASADPSSVGPNFCMMCGHQFENTSRFCASCGRQRAT